MPNNKPYTKPSKVDALAKPRSIPPSKQIDPRQLDWVNKLLSKSKDI
jgi:hypothetical protein